MARALNVSGGVERKQYILEETGCGLALSTTTMTLADVFMVNGTGLRDIWCIRRPFPLPQQPGRHLHRCDRKSRPRSIRLGRAVAIGDYDNDGFDDLVVTYWGGMFCIATTATAPSTDVSEKTVCCKKDPHHRWNTGLLLVDYDRDGHLDLFVANMVNFDPRTTPVAGSNSYCRYCRALSRLRAQGMGRGTNICITIAAMERSRTCL